MKRIGILSDTHGTFDRTLRTFLDGVDEIWHAGDLGRSNWPMKSPASNLCGPFTATSTEASRVVPTPSSHPSDAKRFRC